MIRKKLVIPLFFLLLIIFNFSLLTLSEANAQSFSLSLSPPLLEVMIQPGKKITYAYQIKNNSPSPITFITRILPFEPIGEQGQTKIIESSIRQLADKVQNYENWFSFLNADIALGQPLTLDSNQDLQLVLKISLPQNAPEGDYYQTLFLEQVSPNINNQNTIAQTLGMIGGNILLTISESGRPEKKAEIIEFTPKNALLGRFFDSFSKPEFTLRIKNTGTTFFKPRGEIVVGKNKGLSLRPDNILANTTRQIQCEDGPCQTESPPIFGHYQAQLKFTLDEGGQSYEKNVSFWVLPIKLTTGIIVAILLLYSILSLRKKGKRER